ncbi:MULTISPECIES: alanine--tRNA ligase [unclassified Enterococcus]|uniref:alanine--tRNA ligase n=1 Tax=unclassified Enterococcus TaxID=2608891 RepID=UPI0015523379|nr:MULTISPECIES: alanine--tRNA ligase [unclassified Enterococcus]MBS7577638.1 alanine--tRNA ligase [Enterococcus sp. MMGLQ5-2]MBS7584168.1 alanine--tRNA ligase [Enterococcus sp. MMGLQ5-1]NPD12026.1 alanine--tRNA ligase [Enterococcus sp. MMGLQ5-1]NPD37471.1 alanine--tRNA ligase [Enterococcus sp. MMGLQ5-2]
MKQLSSAQTRQMFLDFFQSKGHAIEPSASLVPVNDPTLLWINSGVATLKKYFDGSVVPENPRITNAQKSIRTNDIENVGKTARHHTMFEMLGNFSIGDYFRKEAIAWAFELLTSPKWFDFPVDKLYMTYYPDDQDSYNCWLKQGVQPDHLIPIEDNFWEIGAGPSGPDTEIFFDRGTEFDPENIGVKLLAEDIENDRYIEIWNIVLSQFNADPNVPRSEYQELPHKNIDTGMGLERMVSIIQGAPTNFETDLFMPIIRQIEVISGKQYDPKNHAENMSFKVIADHIRSLAFAIGDGALPGNEGRGYVLRRLLRRAVMHGKKLGIKDTFLYQLVPTVGQIMSSYYPEVTEQQEFIEKVIRNEEETFHKTIDAGSGMLEDLLASLKAKGEAVLDGQSIFKLYDTFGFPVELTEELASDEGFKIDHQGFEVAMKAQQERARNARSQTLSMGKQNQALTDLQVSSEFSYTEQEMTSALVAIIDDESVLNEVSTGEVNLVFAHTPFYAESGGQVADKGQIFAKDGEMVAEVIAVQKAPNGQPLHRVKVYGHLVKDEGYLLKIDKERRAKIIKNHTATHLLHAALKNTLGSHANQAGSLNETEFLRFDFTHFGATTKEELAQIEHQVNEKIWAALDVETIETDIDTAKSLGAMALFGEKYGKDVRMVKIADYSLELCGGTHVKNTSEIGIFKIVSEQGIGSGTRRIVAVTSKEAYELYRKEEGELDTIQALVKAPKFDEVALKVENLQAELRAMQKENEKLATKIANQATASIFENVQSTGKLTYIAEKVNVSDMNQLRALADNWKQKQVSDVLLLILEAKGKVNLLVAANDKANNVGIKAGDLIKSIAPLVGGGGGGRPDLAQAGGKDASGIPAALAKLAELLG